MESYFVQLDISVAIERVSHSGSLFKLKSIGEGGRVLSICTEFLTVRRQGVFFFLFFFSFVRDWAAS